MTTTGWAQFDKLAGVLAETNANLHTFEFMLNQYRQLAKIQPFNVTPGAGVLTDPFPFQILAVKTFILKTTKGDL